LVGREQDVLGSPLNETIEEARRVRAEAARVRIEAQEIRNRTKAMMAACIAQLERARRRPQS